MSEDSGKPLMRLEGWQPIETAPKHEAVIVYMCGGINPPCVTTAYQVQYNRAWEWRTCGNSIYTYHGMPVDGSKPAHWMPLPLAPQGASQPAPPPEDGR